MAGTTPQSDLVATIGADLTGLLNGLRDGTVSAQAFAQSVAASGRQAERALQGVNQNSGRAAFALTNLGRVAQDAPFGFIAIQNNISPLVESFGSLVRETGSVSTAFSSLASSLLGPAGIGLAISAVTAGLTLYFQSQQRSKSATDQTAEATKKLQKEEEAYLASLTQVQRAQLDGEKSAQDETTRLKILYDAASNAASGKQKQNEAYDELNKLYPQIFSNSQRDATLAGQASQAYLNLANSILQAATAHAAESLITKNEQRRIENQFKLNDLVKQESDTRREIAELADKTKPEDDRPQIGASTFSPGVNSPQIGTKSADAQYKLEQSQQRLNDLNDRLNGILQKKNNILTDTAGLALKTTALEIEASSAEALANYKTINELNDPNKTKKVKKPKFEPLSATGEIQTTLGTNDAIQTGLNLAGMQSSVTQELGKTNEAVMDGLLGWQKLSQAQQNNARVATHNNKVYQETQQVVAELGSAIGNGLTSAFQQVLSGSQSFLSAIGGVLAQLIEKLLAAAAAALLVSVAIAAFTGGGSLAAAFGSGSNGFASLFNSFSGFKIPGHASGGITNGAHLAMVGEGREREAILPLSKLNQFVSSNGGGGNVQVQGKISGTTIRLQQIRQDKRTARLT